MLFGCFQLFMYNQVRAFFKYILVELKSYFAYGFGDSLRKFDYSKNSTC